METDHPLTQELGVTGQTAANLGLWKTAAWMLRNSGQAVVQLSYAHHIRVVHLIEEPQHTVTLDRLIRRELTKRPITAQQDPGPDLRECKGEAIRKGKRRRLLPIGEGALHTVTIQFFNREAESSQLSTPPSSSTRVRRAGRGRRTGTAGGSWPPAGTRVPGQLKRRYRRRDARRAGDFK